MLAVSTAGTAFATRPGSGQIVRVDPGSDPVTTDLDGGPLALGNPGTGTPVSGRSGDIQLTTVGDLAVVLDRADSALRVNNRRLSKTLHWRQQLLTPGLDRCGSNGIPQRR